MAMLVPPATPAVRESVTVVVEPISMVCGWNRRLTVNRGLTSRRTTSEAAGRASSRTPT